MAAWVTLISLVLLFVAYRLYATWVGVRVFRVHEPTPMPAHEKADGRDHVATPKMILWGHHFTSVAGAAPIIGPCVAAYWGWLPALLWILVGSIFLGAVHDYGALVASVRHGGRSVADMAATALHPRARTMFLCFVLVFVWLVLAVFAMAIASLFVTQPTSVIPVNLQILVALAVGWLLYKKRVEALVPSLVALALLYALVWVGAQYPVDFTSLGLSKKVVGQGWVIFLLAYAAVASVLPVWLLLQPRDYINSHQLLVGLFLLFVGIFVAQPQFDAPAVRTHFHEAHPPSIFPLLFVTVACGAISGFHGLVSSGTTSKQLDRMGDAKFIAYGSMLGEGAVAIASTMAAVAGIALVGACELPGQGAIADLTWARYYDSWTHAQANKASAFVLGSGALLQSLGLPGPIATTLMAVLVISFAATTLDTATRIQRFIIAELGAALHIRALTHRSVATALAVIPAAAMALVEIPDSTGGGHAAGWLLWPIFGISNQMLAGLTLLVLLFHFTQPNGDSPTPRWPLLVPFVVVTLVTLVASFAKLTTFIDAQDHLLTALTLFLVSLQLWMLLEGAARLRSGKGAAQ